MSPIDLPELYRMQASLIRDRGYLPALKRQGLRRAGWRLVGAVCWLPGTWAYGWDYGAAAPFGFIYGMAFLTFAQGVVWNLAKAWKELVEVERLDKDNRRILEQVSKEIQERINP